MADFDDQSGAPLGREKQSDLISPIFPSGMRPRRIHCDLSLATSHGCPSVFLSCLHIKTVGSCWLLVVGCLAPNNQQLPTVRIKCNKKEIANDTLRVLAPNHQASVPSAQVFAIPIFNIQKHAEIVKKK